MTSTIETLFKIRFYMNNNLYLYSHSLNPFKIQFLKLCTLPPLGLFVLKQLRVNLRPYILLVFPFPIMLCLVSHSLSILSHALHIIPAGTPISNIFKFQRFSREGHSSLEHIFLNLIYQFYFFQLGTSPNRFPQSPQGCLHNYHEGASIKSFTFQTYPHTSPQGCPYGITISHSNT